MRILIILIIITFLSWFEQMLEFHWAHDVTIATPNLGWLGGIFLALAAMQDISELFRK